MQTTANWALIAGAALFVFGSVKNAWYDSSLSQFPDPRS